MRKKKPKYNLPRTAEVQPCEWPSDSFLRAAGIYEDFYYLAENEGITEFLQDKCDQYLLLTNTFVKNFHFHARKSPPTVEFYLYDEHKEMTIYDFVRFANYLLMVASMHHVLEMWNILLMKLP